jgi:hypothetical protein
MSGTGRFPFDPIRENLLYRDYNSRPGEIIYKTLMEARFTDTLTFEGYRVIRAQTIFFFVDSIGKRYSFLASTLGKILTRNRLVNNQITGTFIPVKRGESYTWDLED